MVRAAQSYSSFDRKGITRIVYLQRSLLALSILTSVEALAGIFLLFREGLPIQAIIPLISLVGSILIIVLFYRTGNFTRATNVQISIAFILPFSLQFFFGGIVASGLMMIWSFLGLAATLILVSRSNRWHWLIFYVILIVLSFLFDFIGLVQKPAFVTPGFSTAMLAFNLTVIIPVAYALVKNKLESDIDLFRNIRNTNIRLSETLTELERHKRLLEQAQRISRIAHFELDLVSGSEFWSEEIYAILDINPIKNPASFQAYISCLREDDRLYRLSHPLQTDSSAKDFRFTLRTTDRNGHIRHIEEIGIVIKDPFGKNVRIQGTIQDITEEKQVEDTLTRAVRLAESANQAKAEFLSSINHEIRTPLTSIVGLSRLLRRKVTDKQLSQYTERISAAGDQLLNLLNDLLQLSNLQSGEIRVEQAYFQTSRLLEDITAAAAIHNLNKLYFYVNSETAPEYLYTDRSKLQQVLTCLLSNAFKFTKEGSVILNVQPERDNRVSFSVIDTGIGISEHHLHTIFEAFKQERQGLKRQYGGAGVGLALALQLAEAMNGTLVVESKPDVGSAFTLTIPFREQVPV